MDIQQLKYFLYVAKYRNFTKAAEHFYIGQPALSRQIFDLEKQIGVQLFIRNNRSVELTAAGEVLQQEGSKLIDHFNSVIEKTQKTGEGKLGYLKLATLGYFNYNVANMIRDFHIAYPLIKFIVERHDMESINDSIMCEDADLGLTFLFCVTNNEDFEWKVICKEGFSILTGQDTAIAKKDEICVSDLINENFVLLDYAAPHFFNKIFPGFAFTGDKKSNQYFTYTSTLESLLMQVGAGMGIALLPDFSVADLKTNPYFSIKKIVDLDTNEDVVLVWNKNSRNFVNKQFLEFAHNFFQIG